MIIYIIVVILIASAINRLGCGVLAAAADKFRRCGMEQNYNVCGNVAVGLWFCYLLLLIVVEILILRLVIQ